VGEVSWSHQRRPRYTLAPKYIRLPWGFLRSHDRADVLEDVFHAKQRVAREFRRFHTDYGLRSRELSALFFQLTPKKLHANGIQ
jgi:hypothetical protein